MIQLTYEPAFDPLHAMYRALRLRSTLGDSFRMPRELFRILDFYLVFPRNLADARLRQGHRRLKTRAAATKRAPRYGSQPDDAILFERMRPYEDAALDTLAIHHFFSLDALADGWVQSDREEVPEALAERIQRANDSEADLMQALCIIASDYALEGANGLKDRTGLLEHRYDAV